MWHGDRTFIGLVTAPSPVHGGGGIRTHEGLRPPVFKTGALNRSATPPAECCAPGLDENRGSSD